VRRRDFCAATLALAACASSPPANQHGDGGARTPERRPAPFGSRPYAYPAGTAVPTGTRQELDAAVIRAYDAWKAAYVAPGCDGFIVKTSGGTGAKDAITLSEGLGYGMLATVLMTGHDPEAQTVFDGFLRVYRRFPSKNNRDLMAWAIGPTCRPIEGENSATDGDLDVGFALLLANRQWGSDKTDYFGEAKRVIAAIAASDLNRDTNLPLLGDWATSAQYFYATRTSDFMPDHFRAFADASGLGVFSSSIDRMYALTQKLQESASGGTGLVPDFVVDTKSTPRAAPPDFLEGPTDGDYSYNACRVPWRIGTDFIVSGDVRARQVLSRLTGWMKRISGGEPSGIAAGYRLDGAQIADGPNAAFVGPLAVAAAIEPGNQEWLDALWKWLVLAPADDYYADSIRLLSMLVVTGNWWVP
jgi:endoglucanase